MLSYMARTSYIQWDNNDIHFVARWIFIVLAHWKIQSVDRYVTSQGRITWFLAYQFLFFHLNAACLVEKQQIPIL